MITDKNFVDLVAEMRDAQKNLSKKKSVENLRRAKTLEKDIDNAIKIIKGELDVSSLCKDVICLFPF